MLRLLKAFNTFMAILVTAPFELLTLFINNFFGIDPEGQLKLFQIYPVNISQHLRDITESVNPCYL